MINPYDGINLQASGRILSVSHQHLSHSSDALTQSNFDTIYGTGVRHFAISRYRPSLITYPVDYENNTFVYVNNPFESTEDISALKTDYACTVQAYDDVVGTPNSEHIYPLIYFNGSWSRWNNVHINGMGCTYESGLTPDENTGYQNAGMDVPYSEGFRRILASLQYPDGGGIIINHPGWTNRTKHVDYNVERYIRDCLDFDRRVLGTDIIEDGDFDDFEYDSELIDNILLTGRRCWIFCNSDWNLRRGRNELLIPTGLTRAETEYECLKAYRNGAFFGRVHNSELSITSIGFSDDTFTMTAEHADGIVVIIDGESTEYESDSVAVEVPSDAVYVRAYAYISKDDDPEWNYLENDLYKDAVFTNPIILRPAEYNYHPAYDIESKPSTRMAQRIMTYG